MIIKYGVTLIPEEKGQDGHHMWSPYDLYDVYSEKSDLIISIGDKAPVGARYIAPVFLRVSVS